MYTATARISVRDTGPEVACETPCSDPYFLRTQVEILRSKPILTEVVRHLNLAAKWSVNGEALASDAIYAALSQSVDVRNDPDTSVIAIVVQRPDPAEAAGIANAMVRIYRDSRLELLREEKRVARTKFEEALNAQQARVTAAEKEVEDLRVALGITTNGCRPMNDVELVALKNFESERDVAQSNVIENETALKVLANLSVTMLVEGKAEIPVQDALVARLIHDIREINGWLEVERVQKSENHPDVKRYRHQKERCEEILEERLVGLRQRSEMELRLARGRVEKMNEQLAVLRTSASRFGGEVYQPYRMATAQLDSEQCIYKALEARLRMEMALPGAEPCSPVKIISVAEPEL
jgi:uncharacterized protein involved in exopolysaccharide biosynthesis